MGLDADVLECVQELVALLHVPVLKTPLTLHILLKTPLTLCEVLKTPLTLYNVLKTQMHIAFADPRDSTRMSSSASRRAASKASTI